MDTLEIIKKYTAHMTKKEIGELLEVSEASASRKVRGLQTITLDDRQKIVNHFDIKKEDEIKSLLTK